MKKSLLALAVLGAFAGAASAQSSVTLYGRVDGGYGRFDPKEGTTTNISGTTGIFTGTLGGNRLGVRGSEDLGGGLKAIFDVEAGFALDDGTSLQGGRLFGRQAYVGFNSSGFGSVVLGRLAAFSSGTGDFDKFGSLDPFRTGVGTLGFQNTMSSANSLRLDNTIAYMTPDLSGFSAGVGYTARASGQELAGGSSNNNSGYISYINFGSGPFYAVLTYDQLKLGEVATDPKEKHLQVGASWDFKVFKLSGAYASESNQFAFGPAGVAFTGTPITGASVGGGSGTLQSTGSDATAYALGGVIPIGPHRIALSWQQRKVDATATAGEAKRQTYTLGYEYNFSRRTIGYIYYGNTSDKDAYKIANWGGASSGFVGVSHAF